ncbi:MAG: tetraacyldisaccharide 4'-kinase [Flammeovirgaceae bacterium]|nr:tetraacyldisaccharide 4'-kinase [Flammeovirgaceae bacterium]
MAWWQFVLFPFALIYDLITRFRNHLYNIKQKTSIKFEANVIGVGNLEVGGTGKSPMIDFLIQYFLSKNRGIATLSRGYGRKTRGFRLGQSSDTAVTLGDEPMIYQKKYGKKISVAVSEDRAIGIPYLLAYNNDIEVILLDDAYQHRSVKPSLSILLSTFKRPFYDDFLIPTGRLREARRGAFRADIICFTKAPVDISNQEQEQMIERTRQYHPNVPIFFTSIRYGALVSFGTEKAKQKVIGLAGIADNNAFKAYLKSNFDLIEFYEFSDHYDYKTDEINKIVEIMAYHDAMLVTTEKDFIKLEYFKNLIAKSCFYLPIEIKFIKSQSAFLKLVEDTLIKYPKY